LVHEFWSSVNFYLPPALFLVTDGHQADPGDQNKSAQQGGSGIDFSLSAVAWIGPMSTDDA
jgi:hypothetical protein